VSDTSSSFAYKNLTLTDNVRQIGIFRRNNTLYSGTAMQMEYHMFKEPQYYVHLFNFVSVGYVMTLSKSSKYKIQDIIKVYGAYGSIKNFRRNRNTRRKLALLTLCEL
jgi:hypothetical protein